MGNATYPIRVRRRRRPSRHIPYCVPLISVDRLSALGAPAHIIAVFYAHKGPQRGQVRATFNAWHKKKAGAQCSGFFLVIRLVARLHRLGRTRASVMTTACEFACNTLAAALDRPVGHGQSDRRCDHAVRSGTCIKHERLFFCQAAQFCKAFPLIRRDLVKLIFPAHRVTPQSLSGYLRQSCPVQHRTSLCRCPAGRQLSDRRTDQAAQ